jgi:hypothetical protein
LYGKTKSEAQNHLWWSKTMALTFVGLAISFLLFWVLQINLVWYWHKKNDGADGKWPWFISFEHGPLLDKLNPEQQKEFMRLMHLKLRGYDF